MTTEASNHAAALFHVVCGAGCITWCALAVLFYAALRKSGEHSRRGQ